MYGTWCKAQFIPEKLMVKMGIMAINTHHVPLIPKNHINALILLVTPKKNLFFLTRSNPRISISKALIMIRLKNTIG